MAPRLACALFVALLLAACAGAPRAADPSPLHGADPATVEVADEVDYSCRVDADCTVKNIGNCCGYYPACVNRDSPTFPDRVKARCEAEGMVSICGFPEITGCRCDDGRCSNVTGAGAGGIDLR